MGAVKSGKTDSCGCAMSAKFLVTAFILSGALYGWQFSIDQVSLGSFVGRVALITFIAAGVGKVVGILRYRLRGRSRLRLARWAQPRPWTARSSTVDLSA